MKRPQNYIQSSQADISYPPSNKHAVYYTRFIFKEGLLQMFAHQDICSLVSFTHSLHIEIEKLSTDQPSQSISEASILVNPKDAYNTDNNESAMAYLQGSG